MALEGSIRDFGLTDIFQLIAIQKKSGVLELASDVDSVGIYFQDGQIVRVTSLKKDETILLGHLLVRSGRITSEQLAKALDIQRETLQRLGYILLSNRFLTQEELREALHHQTLETVYKVFRWSRGHYKFNQEVVTFDPSMTIPIDPEHVLMDGIRMIDEWPMIESKIRMFDMVYAQVEGVREKAAGRGEAPLQKVEAEFKAIVSRLKEGEEEDLSSPGETEKSVSPLGLTGPEEIVLSLVGGRRDVRDIIDASRLGEFNACKALAGLLDKGFIQEVGRKSRPSEEEGAPRRAGFEWLSIFGNAAFYGVIGVALALALLLWFVRTGGIALLGGGPSEKVLLPYFAANHLETIRFLAEVYELKTGRPPSSAEDLLEAGLARRSQVSDPWGHAVKFDRTERGEAIVRALGPDGTAGTADDVVLRLRSQRRSATGANPDLDKEAVVKDNPPSPAVAEEKKP